MRDNIKAGAPQRPGARVYLKMTLACPPDALISNRNASMILLPRSCLSTIRALNLFGRTVNFVKHPISANYIARGRSAERYMLPGRCVIDAIFTLTLRAWRGSSRSLKLLSCGHRIVTSVQRDAGGRATNRGKQLRTVRKSDDPISSAVCLVSVACETNIICC